MNIRKHFNVRDIWSQLVRQSLCLGCMVIQISMYYAGPGITSSQVTPLSAENEKKVWFCVFVIIQKQNDPFMHYCTTGFVARYLILYLLLLLQQPLTIVTWVCCEFLLFLRYSSKSQEDDSLAAWPENLQMPT